MRWFEVREGVTGAEIPSQSLGQQMTREWNTRDSPQNGQEHRTSFGRAEVRGIAAVVSCITRAKSELWCPMSMPESSVEDWIDLSYSTAEVTAHPMWGDDTVRRRDWARLKQGLPAPNKRLEGMQPENRSI